MRRVTNSPFEFVQLPVWRLLLHGRCRPINKPKGESIYEMVKKERLKLPCLPRQRRRVSCHSTGWCWRTFCQSANRQTRRWWRATQQNDVTRSGNACDTTIEGAMTNGNLTLVNLISGSAAILEQVEWKASSPKVGGQLLPLWPLSWPFISQLEVFFCTWKRRSRRSDDIRFLRFLYTWRVFLSSGIVKCGP